MTAQGVCVFLDWTGAGLKPYIIYDIFEATTHAKPNRTRPATPIPSTPQAAAAEAERVARYEASALQARQAEVEAGLRHEVRGCVSACCVRACA